jgi:hypothetical protein
VAELSPLTGNGAGILTMAIAGGAILPMVQSAIADQIGLHHAFLLTDLYVHFLCAERIEAEQAKVRESSRREDSWMKMLIAAQVAAARAALDRAGSPFRLLRPLRCPIVQNLLLRVQRPLSRRCDHGREEGGVEGRT